jgi:hypothetical protein
VKFPLATALGTQVRPEDVPADKLNTHDTDGLVRYAVRRGLIQAAAAWCALL